MTGDGILLICEHGDRRIATYPINDKYGLKTMVDNFNGMRLNSPNDITVKSDGSVYFTDPPYGLPMKEKDTTREISFSGIYRVKNNGIAALVIKTLPLPNGLTFSPDEKQLYVTNSEEARPQIMSYDIDSDGNTGNGRIFFDATNLERKQQKQITDGLKTDKSGNIWASGPGGLLIIGSNGKLLGKIETYEVISNCAWDSQGTTLYITAGSFLYRLRLK